MECRAVRRGGSLRPEVLALAALRWIAVALLAAAIKPVATGWR